MTDEDREAQNAFIVPYVKRLNPVGEIELQLAQTIALDNFRLNRLTGPLYGGLSLKAFEENMLAYGELGPLGDKIQTEHARVHHALVQSHVFVLNERSFNNLSLYDQRITRNIHKNLKLLREEQALRKAEEKEKALLESKPLTLTGPLYGDLSRTASTTTEENGFGFSSVLSKVESTPETPRSPPVALPKAA